MDEVGRGPLAGDVVTACVVMPGEPVLPWVDDSKKLSESGGKRFMKEIMSMRVACRHREVLSGGN